MKEVWVLVFGFFMFLSAVSVTYYRILIVDPRGRLGGLVRKVGTACEESEDNEGGISILIVVGTCHGPCVATSRCSQQPRGDVSHGYTITLPSTTHGAGAEALRALALPAAAAGTFKPRPALSSVIKLAFSDCK